MRAQKLPEKQVTQQRERNARQADVPWDNRHFFSNTPQCDRPLRAYTCCIVTVSKHRFGNTIRNRETYRRNVTPGEGSEKRQSHGQIVGWQVRSNPVTTISALITWRDMTVLMFLFAFGLEITSINHCSLHWPCQCRRCWSRWRWPLPPNHSSGLRSGSPDRAPPSEPGVQLSSCSGWSVGLSGSQRHPLYSQQRHHSHMVSHSPTRLERDFKKERRGLAGPEGDDSFV